MINEFKIPVFAITDGSISKVGYDTYTISYLKGGKIHLLRIVVNGYLTKETINMESTLGGYKNRILSAIKEYKENSDKTVDRVSRKLKFDYIQYFYSDRIIRNVKEYLLPINKEESRDVLSSFNLLTIKK